MKEIVIWALIAAAVLFLLPVLTIRGDSAGERQEGAPQTENMEPASPAGGTRDKGRAVRLKQADGSVEEMTMRDYLWGVVAAEMPASFEEEALKAQVCAARTYTAVLQSTSAEKHPDADICADSKCCQAYVPRGQAEARWGLNARSYGDKLDRAVDETDGLGILYEGRPIQALFFSSAPGRTVDAVEVWGNSVDYLKSVDSPEGEEVPNYHSRAEFTADQVRQRVRSAYPEADLSGDPAGWFGHAEHGESGIVRSLVLGGVTLTGGQARSLFGLRSSAFTVAWDGEKFVFEVTGYGHGVGMSQYGANAMAREGKDFKEILTWYYTGTELAPLWG